MKKPSVQDFTVDQVVNGSARVSVKSVSGPIKVAGAYGFTLRDRRRDEHLGHDAGGDRSRSSRSSGRSSLPKTKRRHFFTPFDLMNYGFNPLFPAYPQQRTAGTATASGRDFQVYGVTGTREILGIQTVKVPAGTFQALAVRTTLNQAGFKFGSGTRTSWFAPSKGLVKLVFQHADRSTSTVVLVK